jgi:hypothetical protein
VRPYWLLPVLLLLAGCERGFGITVSGPPDQPVFELNKLKAFGVLAGPVPAIDSVSVLAEASPGQLRQVWTISRAASCAPTPRLRYGVTPPEYRTLTTPAPLVDNVVYRVSMSGCGFYGAVTFKILGGRIFQAQGNGDLPVHRVEAAH